MRKEFEELGNVMNCGNCKKWEKDDNEIPDKFRRKANSHSELQMGWCGVLLTGNLDYCPKHEIDEIK